MRSGNRYRKKTPRRNYGRTFLIILLLLLLVGGGYGYYLFFEDEQPQITLEDPPEFMGELTDISFSIADNKSGLRSIEAVITQGDREKTLVSKEFQRNGFNPPMGPTKERLTLAFNSKQAKFAEGKAIITITARDQSFSGFLKGNSTQIQHEVIIDTKPPKIQLLHGERYISPGGTGIAIYRQSGESVRHGVYIGDDFHPGYLIGDGRNDVYISFFALPYTAETIVKPHIFAEDKAGNSTKFPISPVFKMRKFKVDRINVGDGFLSRKIPEFEQYYPDMTGNMLDKYLYTNNEVRKQNNAKISEISKKSSEERFWQGVFTRMPGSSRAGYADQRTYYYKGKAVDKQVHLGMDIASTQRAEVTAANKGQVLYADYLGIYGNLVILDHGQGLASLYSHLSQIQVAVGDLVEQGKVLGLTGVSGMAGGDHLHFSILVNGIFVTPKEWWDPHWVDVNVEGPIVDSKF